MLLCIMPSQAGIVGEGTMGTETREFAMSDCSIVVTFGWKCRPIRNALEQRGLLEAVPHVIDASVLQRALGWPNHV